MRSPAVLRSWFANPLLVFVLALMLAGCAACASRRDGGGGGEGGAMSGDGDIGQSGGTGGAATASGGAGGAGGAASGGTGGTASGGTGGTASGGTGGAASGGTGGAASGGAGGAASGGAGGTASGGAGGTASGGTGGAAMAGGGTGGAAMGTGGGAAGGLSGARARARVFLSGHSLLDNPIPDHLVTIAQSRGDDFNYNTQNVIGSPIRVRTRGLNPQGRNDWAGYRLGKNRTSHNMDVIGELLNPVTLGPGERYDTLVIAERNDILGTLQWESTTGLLRHYHDRMLAGNSQSITLLYHAWQGLNKADPAPWIAFEKAATPVWECAASKVNLTLMADGRPQAVATLPAGRALVDLVERALAGEVPGLGATPRARLDAIFQDDVHLTNLGAYFAASLIYAAVFRKTPEGAAVPAGLSAETVRALQRIAWQFISGYYAQPNVGVHTMAECRTAAARACPLFWMLVNRPDVASTCAQDWNNANGSHTFRWPDPNLEVWPAP